LSACGGATITLVNHNFHPQPTLSSFVARANNLSPEKEAAIRDKIPCLLSRLDQILLIVL